MPYTPDPGTAPTHQEEHHHYLALRKVRHTILRLIGDHYSLPRGTHGSWQGCDLDLTDVTIDCNINFNGAVFSDSRVSFTGATFTDGIVFFNEATFTGSRVSFDRATGPVPRGLLAALGTPVPPSVTLPAAWLPSNP
ncbi:pentapeptide repeat-containing protein [Streptomyces sp. 549]|uniref:pentapeptide repeat-containing protein n=1 Tax=Streptomyces sp. 549 TaxID=3049076 RepID=UPI0024C258AD|nr:pentapeptide repeat-containing protein [Streptomyces sp. 549]MDK1476946.1 pentapeptide repeat-containing protein [Streptomyces sp. 549]